MSQKFAMDYIDVAARLVEFRTKHPEGSLQPADLAVPFRIETIGDQTFIVVVAAAYRSPDDPKPGIGMAYEQFPGRTPYTKGSELQNAETSAWGRAIVAALAADTKKGVASAEEVRNRQAERDEPAEASQEPSEADQIREQIKNLAKVKGVGLEPVAAHFHERMKVDIRQASVAVLAEYREYFQANGIPQNGTPQEVSS
jgi:hypothetical protein